MIAVVVPTIPGREESLQRTLGSYSGFTVEVVENSPCAGTGWRRGVERFVEKHGEPEFVHLTNDDCELVGDLDAAAEAAAEGNIVCPVVYNTDRSVQSAGGDMRAGNHLLTTVQPDWTEVDFTTVPFMTWEQWRRIGMPDVHYASDVWASYRGRQVGHPTVLRHDFRIVHHMHPVGRGAGMSQTERDQHDWAIVQALLREAVSV